MGLSNFSSLNSVPATAAPTNQTTGHGTTQVEQGVQKNTVPQGASRTMSMSNLFSIAWGIGFVLVYGYVGKVMKGEK